MRSCGWLIAHGVSGFVCARRARRRRNPSARPTCRPAQADSLRRMNTASILFDQNLNTFNWIGRLAVDTQSPEHESRSARNIWQTSFNWRERLRRAARFSESSQQQIHLLLGRRLSTTTEALARWSSLVYSDNKGIGLSNASSHSVLAGLDLVPLPLLTLTPLAGYRWDRQGDIRDRGPSLDMGSGHTRSGHRRLPDWRERPPPQGFHGPENAGESYCGAWESKSLSVPSPATVWPSGSCAPGASFIRRVTAP